MVESQLNPSAAGLRLGHDGLHVGNCPRVVYLIGRLGEKEVRGRNGQRFSNFGQRWGGFAFQIAQATCAVVAAVGDLLLDGGSGGGERVGEIRDPEAHSGQVDAVIAYLACTSFASIWARSGCVTVCPAISLPAD
ncbi:hypothetical protein AHiyo8_55580 [Arthrobacter sp. Hiyo8]|nr:hypothetical protein AHiyo8_55580 [Arthrobacter sp. Hiyo8]